MMEVAKGEGVEKGTPRGRVLGVVIPILIIATCAVVQSIYKGEGTPLIFYR